MTKQSNQIHKQDAVSDSAFQGYCCKKEIKNILVYIFYSAKMLMAWHEIV